jgi:hypothetical protein
MNAPTPFIRNSTIIELLTPSQASKDIDRALQKFREKYLKILASGDGSSRPPRLKPSDLGIAAKTVTAAELLRTIGVRAPAAWGAWSKPCPWLTTAGKTCGDCTGSTRTRASASPC